jgi:hypothetical protein
MAVLDYSRSFVTFIVPTNNARLQLEGRCTLSGPDGHREQYLMFASCKGEDTYGQLGGLFLQPNYDFSGIFGDTRFCLHRVRRTSDLEGFDGGEIAARFTGMWPHHLREAPARPLESIPEIIQATLANEVIVGRNEITDPASGLSQLIEYPVKTMNVNPDTGAFQVDTGPVPLFDFAAAEPEIMARFRWAYVAYNGFLGAEFVCQAPEPLVRDGETVATVTRYSAVVTFAEARNSLFALEE